MPDQIGHDGRRWAGQDLAPPPDIASGGYGRCPPRAPDGSGRTPVADKYGSCPAGAEDGDAGHKKGVWCARGGEKRVPGHKKGPKRARGGRQRGCRRRRRGRRRRRRGCRKRRRRERSDPAGGGGRANISQISNSINIRSSRGPRGEGGWECGRNCLSSVQQ